MSVTARERPGIFTDYQASSVLSSYPSGGAVALVAVSSTGTPEEPVRLTRLSQAAALFGQDEDNATVYTATDILFQNGVSEVVAVSAGLKGAIPTVEQYAAALAAIEPHNGIAAVVCDGESEAVLKALAACVEASSAAQHERIAFAAKSGSVEELTATAAQINSERVVLVTGEVSAGGKTSGFFAAAALAAMTASAADPAIPFSGRTLFGTVGPEERFEENEIDLLITGGMTPVEHTSTGTEVIRAVTTRTTTNGVSDVTFRELNTILIIDHVMASLRTTLKSRMKGAKNTPATRAAMATQAQIVLERKKDAGILAGYGVPVALADPDNPGVCTLEVSFAVVSGLNQIRITAFVTI